MNDYLHDEEAIFNVARRLPPEQRSVYLKQVCGESRTLQVRVESLLKAHEDEGFLEVPSAEAAPTIATPVSEAPGVVIGRYKLLQKIGEGGFGVVFMAEQRSPVVRKVALKVIKPGMDSHAVVARFEAERQALALMDHPNIARILDGGVTDSGRPYFVMELVKGIPITEYCDKNGLSAEDRLRLFIDVCKAVQHAHLKGVIHRDLKPSNILVTLHDGEPVPRVIDFGISKALHQRLTEKTLFTAFGQMIGTAQYMSPEQAEMSGLDVDTRSDVYSLGVLLYELLTGTTPLEAASLREVGYAEIQRMIKETEPPRPSVRLSSAGEELTAIAKHRSIDPHALQRLIRGDLDWIVMKALEKERSRRYESASDFAEDVERFLGQEAVEAHPPSPRYRLMMFVHRNKGQVVAICLLLVALVIGSGGLFVGLLREARLSDKLANANEQLTETVFKLEVKSDEFRKLADVERKAAYEIDLSLQRERLQKYVYGISAAFLAYEDGDIRSLGRLLSDLVPDGDDSDLRGFEWYYLSRLLRASLTAEVYPFDAEVREVAVTSNAERIAVTLENGEMYLIEDNRAARRRLLGPRGTDREWRASGPVAFLDNGQRVAVAVSDAIDASGGSSGRILIMDLASGEVTGTVQHRGEIIKMSVSKDEDYVATVDAGGNVTLWNGKTAETYWDMTTEIPDAEGRHPELALSQDGGVLAIGVNRTIKIWLTKDQRFLAEFATDSPVLDATFSHSGKMLAVGTYNQVSLFDVNALKETPSWSHAITAHCVRFSQDDNTLIVGGIKKIEIWDRAQSKVASQLFHEIDGNVVGAIALASDCQQLVSACGDKIKVWDLDRVRTRQETEGDIWGQIALSVSKDSTSIATGTVDYDVKIWTPSSGAEVLLKGHGDHVRSVDFSHDGLKLVSTSLGSVRIWQIDERSCMVIDGLPDSTISAKFSPNDEIIAAASVDGDLIIWDATKNRIRHQLESKAAGGNRTSVAFSPDGEFLAVTGSDGVEIWSRASSQWELSEHFLAGATMRTAVFSPCGRYLAYGGTEGFVGVWDIEERRNTISMRGVGVVSSVAFASDRKTLAIQAGRVVVLINLATAHTLGRIHTGDLLEAIAFYRDTNGSALVTASEVGTVRLWWAPTGAEIDSLSQPILRRSVGTGQQTRVDQNVLSTGDSQRALRANGERGD